MPVQLRLRDRGLKGAEAWVNNIRLGLRRGLSDRSIRRAATRAGDIMLEEIERSSNQRFERPTGRLAGSFRVRIERSGRSLFNTRVFSRLPYAGIQERGGLIVPRTSRYLTVPLNQPARNRRARDIQGLHRRGRALFLRNTAMYALVRSVRIPATFYFSEAIRAARPKLREALRVSVLRMVREARRRG